MKKYKVTGLPKARKGKNLTRNKFAPISMWRDRNRQNEDVPSEPNYIVPPSPETAVDISESQYPSFWDAEPTMVNPQASQFPTYEVGDQGLGDRTIEQQINTLPNIYGDDPYNDYYKDLNTGETMQCPPGMSAFKGECFPEEVAAQLYQQMWEEEQANPNTEWNQGIRRLDEIIQNSQQETLRLKGENYMRKFIDSDKHDKIEPWETYTTSSSMPNPFEQKGPFSTKKPAYIDPENADEVAQYYKDAGFYVEKKSNGNIEVYPKEVIEDRIINNGFRGRNFKKDWGLNPKQIEAEFGDVMKQSDEVYSGGMINDIINQAMTERKTIGQVIDELPEVGSKGYKKEIKKRFEGKTNDLIDESYAEILKEINKEQAQQAQQSLGNEQATDDETAYAIASGKGPVNIIPGMFDNDPEFQEFQRSRTQTISPLNYQRKDFDFSEDIYREFKVPNTWLDNQDPNSLTPEKLKEGQALYEKYKKDLGKDQVSTIPVGDPQYQYSEDWISRGKTKAEREERRKKVEKIRNKTLKDYDLTSSDAITNAFTGEVEPYYQYNDYSNLQDANVSDRLGNQSDQTTLRRKDLNSQVDKRRSEAAKSKLEEKKFEELNELTGFGESYMNFMNTDPTLAPKIAELQKKGFNNPDLSTEDKTLFLSALQNQDANASDYILNPGVSNTFNDAVADLYSGDAYSNYLQMLEREKNMPVFKQGKYIPKTDVSTGQSIMDKLTNWDAAIMSGLESFLGSSGKSWDEIMYGQPIYDSRTGRQLNYNEMAEIERRNPGTFGDAFYGNTINTTLNPLSWANSINPMNWGDELRRDFSLDRIGELGLDALMTLAPMGKLAKPAGALRNVLRSAGRGKINPRLLNQTALPASSRYGAGQMMKDFTLMSQPHFLRETFKDDGYIDQARMSGLMGNNLDAMLNTVYAAASTMPIFRPANKLLKQTGATNTFARPGSKFAMGYQSPLSGRQYFYGNPNITNPTSIIPKTSGWLGKMGVPFDIQVPGTPTTGGTSLGRLKFSKGGIVLKLDQKEIDQYIKEGYIVEDV